MSKLDNKVAIVTGTSHTPLGRIGRPDGIAPAAVFLASADAAWITGKILRVDGGAWM